MTDRPLIRNYARLEIERRFRLAELPPEVDVDDFKRLRDLFIEGAGLRLRRVELPDGREVVTKLGQKVEDSQHAGDPRCRLMTTIYLQPGEAEPLSGLRGRRCCKRRYMLKQEGLTWAIDVWEEPEARRGLIMAEVECPSVDELEAVAPPKWATEEVTGDPRYSAFELAAERGGTDQNAI